MSVTSTFPFLTMATLKNFFRVAGSRDSDTLERGMVKCVLSVRRATWGGTAAHGGSEEAG